MFPDDKVDPLGYTFDELRQKHCDAHYNNDDSCNITSSTGYSSVSF